MSEGQQAGRQEAAELGGQEVAERGRQEVADNLGPVARAGAAAQGSVLCLLLLCLLWPTSHGQLIEQRLNYGTLFKPMPDLYSTSEYWKHTIVIDLKLPALNHTNIPKCECPELVTVVKHLSLIHNDTFKIANDVIHHILMLSKEAKTDPPRTRRSLLPFVGKIASGLFGLSTSQDLRKVADNINKIHREQDHLKSEFNHEFSRLSSFMATSNERVDNAMAEILENHEIIVGMQQDYNTFAETVAQKQSWMFSKVIDQSYNYNVIQNSFQNLYNGFISLRQGHISPLLISDKAFITAINMIKYAIYKNKPDFKLIHDKPEYYFNLADYVFHRSESALLITVKFPISSGKQPFSLFEIIHYPLPLNEKSTHTIFIQNLPKYIAISGNNFISMPENTLSDCNQNKKFMDCNSNFPLQNTTKPDCGMALYLSNKTAIKQTCDFKFSANSLSPAFRQLNQTHFLAVNNSNIQLHCDDKERILDPCHFCLIQIPCNCSIQTENFILPKRHSECQRHSEITTLHPVNLILLQHFFGEIKTQDILPNTTYSNPLNITVKKFKLYNHKFHAMVLKDEKINLNLHKMIDYAKEDKVIYQDLAEPFIDNPEFDSTNLTLSTLSLIASVCAIIACAITFMKYRKLAATILLYNSVPQTAAANLPSFHYGVNSEQSTQATISDLDHFHTHFLEFNEYVVCILAILVCVYFLYKRVKPFSRPLLYLEISNGKHCAFCPITYLPTCTRNCMCVQSEPPSVTLRLGICPKLEIDWKDLTIQITNTPSPLILPASVKINPILAFSVQRIINDKAPTNIHLWVSHNQFCMPLEVSQTKLPSAPTTACDENKPLLYPNIGQS